MVDGAVWKFHATWEGGTTLGPYGPEVDGCWFWTISDASGPDFPDFEDALLSGNSAEDPTPLLTAIVAALNAGVAAGPQATPQATASMDQVLADYLAWAAETFPWETERDALTLVEREARELLTQPCMDEAADCVMTVTWWVNRSGRSLSDLSAALRQKLAVNRQRTWIKPEGGGPVQHSEPSRVVAAPTSQENGDDAR